MIMDEGDRIGLIVGIIFAALIILWIIIRETIDRKRRQCSQCKKKGALEEIDRQKIKSWTTYGTIHEKKPVLDNKGKETGNYIDTSREITELHTLYEIKMKCKYCGYEENRTDEEIKQNR